MPLGTSGFESTVFASTGSPAAAVPKNAGMASAIGAAAAAKDIRSSAGAAVEAAAAASKDI